jgi:HSP20 family protein
VWNFQEGAHVYRENYGNPRWNMPNETIWRPPTDVYETDNAVVVVIEIAGLGPNDYEILLRGRSLLVAGNRHDSVEKRGYQQMEIRHGKFRTEVHLPWPLEASGQEATYENGFLKIVLPKATARRVVVKAGVGSEGQTGETTGVVDVESEGEAS